jgi:hypothetical protein
MIQDSTLGARSIQSPINLSASGDNIVIAGVSGQLIKVLQFLLVAGGATTLTLKSGASLISGPMSLEAGGTLILPYSSVPIQTISAGDPFIINSSAAVSVGGIISFTQAV